MPRRLAALPACTQQPARRALRCSAWLLAFALLTGCSSLPEPQYPPKPLPELTEPSWQLQLLWQDHSGFGERWQGYHLTPQLNGKLLISGDAQGYIQALQLENTLLSKSRLLWDRQLDSGLSASLTLADDELFAVTQKGRLLKLHARKGEESWQARLPSEALSPPQVDERLVVVQTADGQVSAFNRATGHLLWRHTSLPPSLTLRGTAAPKLTSTQVITGFAQGKLLALDRSTGQVRWETQISQPQGRTDIERLVDIDGQAQLAQGLLLVNSFQGQTQALDPFTGRSRWSRDLSSFHAPLIHQGQVIVVDEASRIHALDLTTGQSLWQQEALFGRQLTAPVLFSGQLVVADYQGYLHLLDPQSGQITGRQAFDPDGIQSQPLVNEDRLLVHSIRGRLGLFTLKKD